MTHTTIATDQDLLTLINVFTVTPENQQQLVDVLSKACNEVMLDRAGFISANVHPSLDGTRVVNYVQWRSREDLEAMLADPGAREHIEEALTLAASEVNLYTVGAVHHA